MPEYIMLMRGVPSERDWESYIEKMNQSKHFRGGSAFGNSKCLSESKGAHACVATGFMRFEADSMRQVELLVSENPTYKAGGLVEIHELVYSG